MLQHRLVTPRAVARAHAVGAPVLAWTVDTPADLDRVVAAGVDGVITNDPRIFANGSFTRPDLGPGYTQPRMRRLSLVAVLCLLSRAFCRAGRACLGGRDDAARRRPPRRRPPRSRCPTARSEADRARRHDRRQCSSAASRGPRRARSSRSGSPSPVTLVVPERASSASSRRELGAAAHFLKAVKLAVRVRTQGFAVPLRVDVKEVEARAYLAGLAAETRSRAGRRELALESFGPSRTSPSPGLRLKQVIASQRALARDPQARARPLELPFQELRPDRHRGGPRQGDRDQPRLEHAPLLRRPEAQALVPDRDRPVVVPDADRQLRDHQHAAATRGGIRPRAPRGPKARSRCRRARATRSARAGWASRRRTSGSTERRTPPRSATRRRTAASAC